jgi:hypothetical protein
MFEETTAMRIIRLFIAVCVAVVQNLSSLFSLTGCFIGGRELVFTGQ